MAIDPKAGLGSRRGRIAGIAAAGSVVLAILAGGAAAFVAQLNSLNGELSTLRRDLLGTKDRMIRLERRIEELSPARPQASERAEPPPHGAEVLGRTSLELGQKEIQLLRDYIKVPPAPPGTPAGVELGGAVPPNLLMPVPSQVTDRIPQLIGARFMTDRNGAIVIVRRGSHQADAIIGPN